MSCSQDMFFCTLPQSEYPVLAAQYLRQGKPEALAGSVTSESKSQKQ